MADPVQKSVPIDDGIVDLQNDSRWQARLEEARARRAEALKRAGKDDSTRRAPRKPWEEEHDAKAPVIPPSKKSDATPARDGFDFDDRMSALRKRLDRNSTSADDAIEPGHNRRQASEPLPFMPETPEPKERHGVTEKLRGERVDALFSDPIFQSSEAKPDRPKLVDPIDLKSSTSEPRPWRRGWLELENEEEAAVSVRRLGADALQSAASHQKPGRHTRRTGEMPAGLAVALLGLAVLPFLTLLPPIERGPAEARALGFAIQPAFGITSAMLERPVQTRSKEWMAPEVSSQIIPLGALQAAPPAFSRKMISMPEIADGPVAAGIAALPGTDVIPGVVTREMPASLPVFVTVAGDINLASLADHAGVRPAPRPGP